MQRLIWTLPLFLIGACAHKAQPVATEPLPASTPAAKAEPPKANTNQTVAAEAARTCHIDRDCKADEMCSAERCVPASSMAVSCDLIRVHFDFDKSELHDQDRPSLEKAASCLEAHQRIKVTIEGNADERGTEEYNLALGDRRAEAVAKYLRALGVSNDQLTTISYGKEKPVCTDHKESCWSKNRRVAIRPPAFAG